jgi:hypothetical protein
LKHHLIDATIAELRLEAADGGELFGSVLEVVGDISIGVYSAHRLGFVLLDGFPSFLVD